MSDKRLFVFPVFYFLLFFCLIYGLGNNWDWQWPYFSDQLPQMVINIFSHWEVKGLGSAQTYASGALFPLLLTPIWFLRLPPEILLSLILTTIFSLGSTLTYLFVRRFDTGKTLAILLALAAMINPAIFYKLLGGHILYLVGFVVFIGLIYFLWFRFRDNLKSSLALGLILALSGVQMQFFVFSTLALILYFCINPKRFYWKRVVSAYGLVLLIHFYWLIHFINGDVSLHQVSSQAASAGFADLERSSFFNILRLTFSDATFIGRFYTVPYQVVSLLFVTTTLALAAFSRNSRALRFSLLSWVLFVVVATGVFKIINIPAISLLYPLLREVGHAAPVVVLFLVFTQAATQVQAKRALVAGLVTAIFILVSLYVYWEGAPRVDYSQARNSFAEIKSEIGRDPSTHRILAYPFFNQYSLKDQEQTIKAGTPMSNSGWDSFTIFSGTEFLDNSTSFNGVQERLLETYDVSELERLNVRYIYDLSSIYRSQAERFISTSLYPTSLQRRNNDPLFFEKLLAANPGRLELVNTKTLKLTRSRARVTADNVQFWKISKTEYLAKLHVSGDQMVELITGFHPGWKAVVAFQPELVCENTQAFVGGTECLNHISAKIRTSKFPIEHIRTANNTNAWLINYQSLKDFDEGNGSGIDSTSSFTVILKIYYSPQSTHTIAWGISLITLLGTLGYLTYPVINKRKDV
jgi:hypothetical protein